MSSREYVACCLCLLFINRFDNIFLHLNLSLHRWEIMPDMPTPRFRGAAVRMSIYGFLVLGGANRKIQAGMIDTELLLEISQIRGFYYRWHKMTPMLRPYALPLAASIDECVFVTEAESCYVHFQMFRYVYEEDGQWTIIR